jgi:hypothetical protein
MRIKILKKLTPTSIDPRADRFQPGFQYEVDSTMGQLLIAERWASLVVAEDGRIVPPVEMEPDADDHSTMQQHRQRNVPSLKDVIAADIAFDDAIAGAIERQRRP